MDKAKVIPGRKKKKRKSVTSCIKTSEALIIGCIYNNPHYIVYIQKIPITTLHFKAHKNHSVIAKLQNSTDRILDPNRRKHGLAHKSQIFSSLIT